MIIMSLLQEKVNMEEVCDIYTIDNEDFILLDSAIYEKEKYLLLSKKDDESKTIFRKSIIIDGEEYLEKIDESIYDEIVNLFLEHNRDLLN